MTPGKRLPPTRSGKISLGVIEVLADGKWHKRAEIFKHVVPKIPREQALRRNETDRATISRQRNNGEAKGRVKPLSVEARVRSGAQTLIRWAMRNQYGALEVNGEWVRLLWVPTKLLEFLPDDLKIAPTVGRGRPPEHGLPRRKDSAA